MVQCLPLHPAIDVCILHSHTGLRLFSASAAVDVPRSSITAEGSSLPYHQARIAAWTRHANASYRCGYTALDSCLTTGMCMRINSVSAHTVRAKLAEERVRLCTWSGVPSAQRQRTTLLPSGGIVGTVIVMPVHHCRQCGHCCAVGARCTHADGARPRLLGTVLG